jgi:hypothetical protein
MNELYDLMLTVSTIVLIVVVVSRVGCAVEKGLLEKD